MQEKVKTIQVRQNQNQILQKKKKKKKKLQENTYKQIES